MSRTVRSSAAVALACGSKSTSTTTSGTSGTATTGTGTSGGTGASSGSTSGGVTVATACTAEATAVCNLYQTCSAGWYTQLDYGGLATCISRMTLDCTDRLAAPGNASNAADAAACAQARASETCEQLYAGATPSVCAAAAGSIANGAACQVSGQCASAYCAIASNGVCGTCQAAPSSGASCAVYGCVSGLKCLSTDVCGAPAGDGGTCGADGDCVFGLTCLSGACLPTADGGSACDTTGKVGPGCNDDLGLICARVGDGGVCTQKPLAAAGQPCGKIAGQDVDTNCAAHGLCLLVDGGTGTCVGAVADGQACDSLTGPPCQLQAKCVSSDGGSAGICMEVASESCGVVQGGTAGTTGGSTSTGGSTGTSTGGGSAGGNGEFVAQGSFTATSPETASASFTGIQCSLAQSLTADGGASEFNCVALNGDGTSTATFTTPSGITSYSYSADVYFDGPPASGLTFTTASSCGGGSISYGTTAQPLEYNFGSSQQGSNCIISAANAGAWTLSFTSVTLVSTTTGDVWTAHGTYQSTMPSQDNTSSVGTISLSF